MAADAFAVPGYRRRILVTPVSGQCTAALEDDYHAMAVTLLHDGAVITKLSGEMARVPWTPCPGAADIIARTFTGVALDTVVSLGEKRTNCTHLYDLTLLAAAHAQESAAILYDIAVSDQVDGAVRAEIRRNGETVLALAHEADVVSDPVTVAGRSLFDLRDWIEAMPDATDREAARLLQCATIIAHGRAMTLQQHSDISRTPTSCYTFQEERRHTATRLNTIKEFSESSIEPLAAFDGERFLELPNQRH